MHCFGFNLVILLLGFNLILTPSEAFTSPVSFRSKPPLTSYSLQKLVKHVSPIHTPPIHEQSTATYSKINSQQNLHTVDFQEIVSSYANSPYKFMLPTATLVATSCQLAGIGGAALFSPLFLLLFPLLDLELASPAQAVASALLTEVFGFASGLTGYARRGLVDWKIAAEFLQRSVPCALIGAILATALVQNVILLRGLYACLMLGLSLFLIVSPRPDEILLEENCEILDEDEQAEQLRTKIATDGTEYTYFPQSSSNPLSSNAATIAGSTLTGLLGVGVGEVLLPQLVRGRCMPLPIAAGTSVAVVVVTALTAAVIQFSTLAISLSTPDTDFIEAFQNAIPWTLVEYTIPGVLVGGQLAPFLASRKIWTDDQIERFAASLFGLVGLAFGIKAVLG